MSIRAASRVALTVLMLLTLACSVKLPDGRFACGQDSDCPPTMSCHEQLCHRAPPRLDQRTPEADASAEPNAEDAQSDGNSYDPPDALLQTPDATALPDAALSMSRAPLRVLHLAPKFPSLRVEVDAEPARQLSYAELSEPFHGDARSCRVRVRDGALALLLDTQVTLDEGAALLLVETTAGLAARVLKLPHAPSTPNQRALALVNTTRDPLSFVVVDDATAQTRDALASQEVDSAFVTNGSARYLYIVRDSIVLAGFDELAVEPRAALILIGDAERALIDPRGPRLLVLTENEVRTLSADPMVAFVHVATPPEIVAGGLGSARLQLCFNDGTGLVEPADLGIDEVFGPIPVRERGKEFVHVVQPGDDECTRDHASISLGEQGFAKGRRYLVAVSHRPSDPQFTVMQEGQRETMASSTSRMISFGNAATLLTLGTAVRFDFSRWGPVTVGAQTSRWSEFPAVTETQTMALFHQSCWPDSSCRPVSSAASFVTPTSTSAFVLLADPLSWTPSSLARPLTVLAFDGLPWTSVHTP